jgi:hypothetical protein
MRIITYEVTLVRDNTTITTTMLVEDGGEKTLGQKLDKLLESKKGYRLAKLVFNSSKNRE